MSATVHLGDCIEVMRTLPDSSVDAVVTDPPYGLGFMGKAWDSLPPGEEWARECLRVLKPGGHLLAFGGTRTWHRLAVAIEDAGFEVRDSIAWLYGSGFPKSLDVSKAIDKTRRDDTDWRVVGQWLRGHREAAGYRTRSDLAPLILNGHKNLESAAANLSNWENGLSFPTWERWLSLKGILGLPDEMDAEVWRLNGRKGAPGEAWATAEVLRTEDRMNEASGVVNVGQGERVAITRQIKAANSDAAQQWQGWGTALKPAFEPVVVARKPLTGTVAANVLAHGTGALNIDGCRVATDEVLSVGSGRINLAGGRGGVTGGEQNPAGRWPANVVLDESQAAALDEQSGDLGKITGGRPGAKGVGTYGKFTGLDRPAIQYPESTGGASRFFYVAKAPTRERPKVDGVAHPTVKPLTLMRWLVRLVTPPGGTVLEPFAGSGTTVEAALLEGFQCIAIEREPDYLPLIQARLARIATTTPEPEPASLFEIEETA